MESLFDNLLHLQGSLIKSGELIGVCGGKELFTLFQGMGHCLVDGGGAVWGRSVIVEVIHFLMPLFVQVQQVLEVCPLVFPLSLPILHPGLELPEPDKGCFREQKRDGKHQEGKHYPEHRATLAH